MSKSQLEMYIENQENLLKEHNGQIIAVQDGKFLGSYSDELTAYRDMVKRGIKDGNYMIVECTPGNSAYTSFWANLYVPGGANA